MTNPIVVSINDDLLAELEQLAGKATPGPWALEPDEHSCMGAVYLVSAIEEYPQPIARLTGRHDQNYLEAANPATILALLQHVRELMADSARLDFMLREECIMQSMNGSNSPVVYSLCWPHTGERQIDWHKSEREAIDQAISDADKDK